MKDIILEEQIELYIKKLENDIKLAKDRGRTEFIIDDQIGQTLPKTINDKKRFYVDVKLDDTYQSSPVRDGDAFQTSKNGECECVSVKNNYEIMLVFNRQPQNLHGEQLQRIPPTKNIEEQIEILKNIKAGNDAYWKGIAEKMIHLSYHNKLSIKDKLPDPQDTVVNKAVEMVNSKDDSNKYLLIHGPPGTGKTTVIAKIIKKMIEQNKKVLITSWCNVAVDNVIEQLLDKYGQEIGENIVRIGSGGIKISDKVKHLISSSDSIDTKKANVIASTLALTHKILDHEIKFDLVIVDEAGTSMFGQTLLALRFGKKFILSGDHLQLPPIIIDKENHPVLFAHSLFESLIEISPENAILLYEQRRMHPKIAYIISKTFYNDLIETPGEAVGKMEENNILPDISKLEKYDASIKKLLSRQHPAVWIDAIGRKERCVHGFSNSYYNTEEVVSCIYALDMLLEQNIPKNKISIITTYRDQKNIIIDILKKRKLVGEISVTTIDAFQGHENDIVICSLVQGSQNRTMHLERNRINVALSRAKYKLIITGNYDASVDFVEDIAKIIRGYDSLINIKTTIPSEIRKNIEKHIETKNSEIVRPKSTSNIKNNKLKSKDLKEWLFGR